MIPENLQIFTIFFEEEKKKTGKSVLWQLHAEVKN